MYKIVIDTRMKSSSGIGTYITKLIELISGHKSNANLLDNLSSGSQLNFMELNIESKIYSLKEQLLIPKTITPCDVFWSPHYNVPIFPIRAKKRVVTIHDVYHLHNYSKLTLFQKLYVKVIMYAAVHRSDKIITVSHFSKNEILKYYKCNADKISVIHNGIEQNAQISNIDSIRNEYKLPEHYILFVGNVKPHKNLKVLIEAFLKLDPILQERFKIVIVGKKDGFITGDNDIFTKVQSNPVLRSAVVFTGFVNQEDMDTIYSNAAVFVFPSIYEGFGLPPLEAMKCSCPVIASDIPSLREVCGNAALYFDPFDSIELSVLLSKVLVNVTLTGDLINMGKEQIKKFTWESSFDKHMEVFNTVLGNA